MFEIADFVTRNNVHLIGIPEVDFGVHLILSPTRKLRDKFYLNCIYINTFRYNNCEY